MRTVTTRRTFGRGVGVVLAVMVLFAAGCGDDSGTIDAAADGTTSEPAGGIDMAGGIDCAEVQAAMESATDFTGDPTAVSGDDLETDFQKSREALKAFGEQVPELSADVDTALVGMDAIAAAFESIGWDQESIGSDPAKALAFVELIGTADVASMGTAMQNISAWFAAECAG